MILIGVQNSYQSDDLLIKETLTKYIEGSTNGKPDLLKEAFHPDLNLYYVENDEIKAWSGKAYLNNTKEDQPTGETGKILSIDYENDAAGAKVEISMPGNKTPYIDYFLLLKTKGK